MLDCSLYMLDILGYSACCRSSRMWITCNRFSIIFEAFVPHFYLYCTCCIIPKSLLTHPNSFSGGTFKLHAKFDADSLLCSLSHYECDSHTVHMLTQCPLLPPLTSIMKSSLFIYAHSSPLSLAVRLQQCCANCCNHPHINNGWTFSGQKYIMYGPGGKHKARGPNPALHLVLSGPTPCFYPVAVPSSHLTVKE